MTDVLVLGMMIACLGSGDHFDATECMKVMRREKPKTMEQVLDVQELARDEMYDREAVGHCETNRITYLRGTAFDVLQQYGPEDPRDPCEEYRKQLLKKTRAMWKIRHEKEKK